MKQTEQQFLDELDKKLWNAADRLRSNIDAAEYKHVVLGLIFLKYVSDAFDERRMELEAQFKDTTHDYYLDEADQIPKELENRDYYLEKNVFWVPALARWKTIQDSATLASGSKITVKNGKTTEYEFRSINKLIDDALEAIEKENPKLKNVLDKRYTQRGVDATILAGLISEVVGKIPFIHESLNAKDILGHVYEYFLGQFALAEGKKGGQYYTPKSIVTLIVEMLQPYKGRVYDPAMGSGGFFVQSERFIEQHQGKLGNISVYGQESNPTTWRLAAMNMAIRGIDFNFGKGPADTYSNDQHIDLRADFVMANPPFNMKEWKTAVKDNDPRWQYGTPPDGNANFAWLQHMIWHMAPNALGGIVLANMTLASNDKCEEVIRKQLVDADLVDCIINLPDKLFSSTPIGACIWVLSKNKSNNNNKDRKGKILFIDASKLFIPISRTLNDFPNEYREKVYNAYLSWKGIGKEYKDEDGFYKSVSALDVSNKNYTLFPAAYLDFKGTKDDSEDIFTGQVLTDVKNNISQINDFCYQVADGIERLVSNDVMQGKVYKLSDILEKITERLGDRKEPEVLTCTETTGLVFQKDRFAKRIATENTSKYKVVRKGDIVYNPYLLWAGSIDQCWIVDEGITSPAYEVFRVRNGFDPALIGVLLKTDEMLQKYDGISVGTVKRRRRAPPEKFLELNVKIPKKESQGKLIENSLRLENLISLLNLTSRSLKELKTNVYQAVLKKID